MLPLYYIYRENGDSRKVAEMHLPMHSAIRNDPARFTLLLHSVLTGENFLPLLSLSAKILNKGVGLYFRTAKLMRYTDTPSATNERWSFRFNNSSTVI